MPYITYTAHILSPFVPIFSSLSLTPSNRIIMIDSDLSSLHSLTQSHHINRRMGRPRSLLPDPDAPNLAVRW